MNIRNPSALFLAILCALSTCLLPSCRDESLDPTRANNINRLKEMGNRLWLYHENKNRFPDNLSEVMKNPSEFQGSVVEMDLHFISDDGRKMAWKYRKPRKGHSEEEVVVWSPLPSKGKWLALNAGGIVKLHANCPDPKGTKPGKNTNKNHPAKPPPNKE
jgi:hypothetical protein